MPTKPFACIKGVPFSFRVKGGNTVLSGATLRVALLGYLDTRIAVYTVGSGLTLLQDGSYLVSIPGSDTAKLTLGNFAKIATELTTSGGSQIEDSVTLQVNPNLVV